MANAKKCDRCGKFYAVPQCTPDFRVSQYVPGHTGNKWWDFCPTCQKMLEEFLKCKGE